MKKQNKGIILVITGATLWGLGATWSDYLFKEIHINVNWFTTARLIIGGLFLLILHKIFNKNISLFSNFKNKTDIINILIFTLFGMVLNQYSYMLSIFHGNAAIATMLEYMSPIYVIIWLVLRKKDNLKILDTLSLIILVFSLFLLLTNGNVKILKVSDQSLFWGLIAGVSLAFYTIYSKKLLIKFPSLLIIGWSMIIGGLLMNIKSPIWDINLKEIQIINIILILLNILTGTALAYWLYIKSVEYINEKKTIIFSTIEPIIAITSSIFIMHISFEKYQTIGIILILISITQLSLKK